jgi:hypothetical protein
LSIRSHQIPQPIGHGNSVLVCHPKSVCSSRVLLATSALESNDKRTASHRFDWRQTKTFSIAGREKERALLQDVRDLMLVLAVNLNPSEVVEIRSKVMQDAFYERYMIRTLSRHQSYLQFALHVRTAKY